MYTIDTKVAPAPVEREPLLTIDGAELTIPKRFPPTDMLQYLHVVQAGGGDVAAKWALHHALGEEGFWKLIDAGAAIDEHMLKAMIECVTGRLLGIDSPVPGPKGEPETGPDPETASASEPADEDIWPDETSPAPDQV
jgi:hypothetical protein